MYAAETNKAICRRFIQKIFNEGEMALIWDFISPYAINHELGDALGDDPAPLGRSPEWMADLVAMYRHAFPDLHLEVEGQMADGDRVVTTLRMQGTQANSLMAIQATGQAIDISGIRVDRVIEGKIAESWFHFDSLTMLRQLEALPGLNRSPRAVTPAALATASQESLPVPAWSSFDAQPALSAVS